MTTDDTFGRRDRRNDRWRAAALVCLLALAGLLEVSVGRGLAAQRAQAVAVQGENWARQVWQAPPGAIPVPAKPDGRRRILYISNSHAFTGGRVTRHLQDLLDRMAPGGFEILDLSDPGIFAPDMLQRALLGLDFQPDAVILAVAYISFSDRMKLALQAHSVRSFLRPGVAGRLSAGFWWRNYDLGLYCDTLVARVLDLYRYRSALRDTWEAPLARLLGGGDPARPVLFLELDENQSWKFPAGYDRDLFQWRLYAAGRDGHMADLREAVTDLAGAGVPVLAFNLPIHWEKSGRAHDVTDAAAYRRELAGAAHDARLFVDYQDRFPVEFATYDALHPNWHGARLFALDMALRLAGQGYLPSGTTPDAVVDAWLAADSAVSDAYRRALTGDFARKSVLPFRRYDISDPDNARDLLNLLANESVGGPRAQDFLYNLSLRIRYWEQAEFRVPDGAGAAADLAFERGAREEIARARLRAAYFSERLVAFQQPRLARFPVPELPQPGILRQRPLPLAGGATAQLRDYRSADGTKVIEARARDGRVIAYNVVRDSPAHSYQRVDVLGDGSFLLLQPFGQPIVIPGWVLFRTPFAGFGN